MPRIKFLKDHTTGEVKPRTFHKDQEVDFPDTEQGHASVLHFVRRGLAVDLEGEDQDQGHQRMRGPAKSQQAGHEDEGRAGDLPGRSGGFGTPVKGAQPPAAGEPHGKDEGNQSRAPRAKP